MYANSKCSGETIIYAQSRLSFRVVDVLCIKIMCSYPYIAHTYPYIRCLSKGFSLKQPNPSKGHALRNFHLIKSIKILMFCLMVSKVYEHQYCMQRYSTMTMLA